MLCCSVNYTNRAELFQPDPSLRYRQAPNPRNKYKNSPARISSIQLILSNFVPHGLRKFGGFQTEGTSALSLKCFFAHIDNCVQKLPLRQQSGQVMQN